MGLGYNPAFAIKANDNNITDQLKHRLVNLTITDNSGNESDRLSLTYMPKAGEPTPAKGATLDVALGFGGNLVNKGKFIVDEVTISGPPRRVQIVGNAAPMNTTKQKGALQSQKTRSFTDKTLGDIVATIAQEHGLTPKIDNDLASIQITQVDQIAESDSNLLTRLAKKHGAVSKPANGFLLFVKAGESKTASGKTLSNVTIKADQVSNYSARFSSRNDAKRVEATYFDAETGETKTITMGQGEPAFKIVFRYPNRQEAEAAVAARAKEVTTGSDTLDLTMPATNALMALVAEGKVTLTDFGDAENGQWLVKSLAFTLSEMGLQVWLSAGRGA